MPKHQPTFTVKQLCDMAGVQEPASGRIPIPALDKILKMTGWSTERRMTWKSDARMAGLID